MPGHYQMSFGEGGRQAPEPRQNFDVAMAANAADRLATELAIQQTFSNMDQTLADMRVRELQRELIKNAPFPEFAPPPPPPPRQEEAFSGGAVMGPTVAAPLMFGDGRNARGPRAPGQAVYPIAYNTFTPGQRGALNEYLLAGPGKDFSFGLFPALMGLLGAKTKYEQLSSGDYRPVFVGDKLYGSFGEGPFGGNVYTGLPLPSDVAAEYGIPGFDPEDDDDAPEITGTVQDPMTGQEKCPDGYIFDEDLQACRLETAAPVAAPLEARSPTRTYSLLDQAPDGLLEFQRRFGLPEQQTDFSLLT